MIIDMKGFKNRLKINDKIYHYFTFGKIGEYKVVAEIKRQSSVLYEIQCLCCDHGSEPCEIIIKSSDHESDSFEYVDMKNHDDESYDCFHKGEKYYLTPSKALIEKYKEHISDYKREIEKLSKQIDSKKKHMNDLIDHMNNVKEKQ